MTDFIQRTRGFLEKMAAIEKEDYNERRHTRRKTIMM